MIGIKLDGRLGNHMFQYAYILALSKKLNTNFFIDESISKFLLPSFFELKSFNSIQNRCYRKMYYLFFKKNEISILHGENAEENLKKTTKDNFNYIGFFQSEKYFIEHANLIKDNFKIKKELQIDVTDFLNLKEKKTIAVHVRRTDYIDYGSDKLGGKNMTLPISYYENAFKLIPNIEDFTIIYVSDDIDFVKENFIQHGIYTSNNLIEDFQIIQSAEIIITANSSFSWWAAYLSNAKKIIAPKHWLGFKVNFDYPHSIIPDSWNQVNVY